MPAQTAPEPGAVSTPGTSAASPSLPTTSGSTDSPPAIQPALLTGLPEAAELLRSDAAAWRELGPRWGLPLTGRDACTVALQNRLQCYSTQRMTLHGLRQLDRPGILNLHLPGQGPRRALVTGITPETVTLQVGGQRWQMPLTALANIWRGDYATLWRQPEGVRGRVTQGTRGVAGEWLAQRLTELQGKGLIDADASTFSARLAAFQRAQGIDADGAAGPMTFMQVNLAAGVEEPRLSKP